MLADHIVLFDEHDCWMDFLPLTFTRPVSRLRVGITIISEKWEAFCRTVCYETEEYILNAQRLQRAPEGDALYVSGNLFPSEQLIAALEALPAGVRLIQDDKLIAFRGNCKQWLCRENCNSTAIEGFDPESINKVYDIFTHNGKWIRRDFERITRGRHSEGQLIGCRVIGDENLVFLEKDAVAIGATFNTMNGPIWIGSNSVIMENSSLRGPIAIGENSTVNMGCRIYSDTTLGPWCKVGGELNNVVLHGCTNKAHDGFLGNSVIGKWCNIGAGCTASNLKNDYTPVKLWNYRERRFAKTGLQFCGLIMGDHSKAGINTMFNTGTVVGVGCNIHGSGFPRNFIPSFSDGGASGFVDVLLPRFFDTASRVMERRGRTLTDVDEKLFNHIFKFAESFK